MKKIELYATSNDVVVFNAIARENHPLDEVCIDAEYLWRSGKATYVRVSVDGKTYMEIES